MLTAKEVFKSDLDEQRGESEVRDILSDLDRLQPISPERKTRWVWELLQNAKNFAPFDHNGLQKPVDIEYITDDGKIAFTHNGIPFQSFLDTLKTYFNLT